MGIWDDEGSIDEVEDDEVAEEVAEPDGVEEGDAPPEPPGETAPTEDGASGEAGVEGSAEAADAADAAAGPVGEETKTADPGVISPEEWAVLQTRGIGVVVNGEGSTVPLKEVVANYQIRKHADRQMEAVAKERKEFEPVKKRAGELEDAIKELKAWSKDLFTPQRLPRALDIIGAGDVFNQAVQLAVEDQLRRSEMTERERELEDEEKRIAALRETTESQRAAWENERQRASSDHHQQQLIGWVNSALSGVGVDAAVSPSLDRRARQAMAAELNQVFAMGEKIDDVTVKKLAEAIVDDLRSLMPKQQAKEAEPAQKTTEPAKEKPKPPPRPREGVAAKGVERKKRRRSRSLDEVFKEHYDAYEEMEPRNKMRI